MEDYARILDYLPQGHPDQSKFHREPLAYALGVDEFKLFELVPKEGAALGIGQRVYIGKEIDQRTEVLHVKRRVDRDGDFGSDPEVPLVRCALNPLECKRPLAEKGDENDSYE